jgi:uncharacterized protein (UPF0332 family)
MTGQDFLTVANQLAGGSTEAEWRSAISRAYYAAYHVARELMEVLGFTVPRAERAHVYLSRRLANCGHPRTCEAGSDLNSLRGDRNQADYDLHVQVTSQLAILHVRLAEQIVRYLDGARQEPVRSQAVDSMKTYERDVLREQTWRS